MDSDGFVKVISIHTPAKGVTQETTQQGCAAHISIHTPAKGVTIFALIVGGGEEKISIHTPAKGVTVICGVFGLDRAFQSTLPRRE